MFKRSYPEHAIETWDLPTVTIQASNRYFTRGSDTGALNILDLDHNIDPYGILAAAAKDGKQGRWNSMLHEGDAVKMNISLVTFLVRNARNRVSVILHGVNLLDNHYSRVHQRHRDQRLSFREIQLGKLCHQFPEEAYVQFYKDSEPEGTSMTLENGDEEVQNDDQGEEEYQQEFENAGKGMRRWSIG
ncbi:hypothetical protein C8J56DRAFT_900210 [Mycena floridula]|nr:hypothetical protein C8J56DRAFT_900210 [Mycena floridula]